MGPVNASFNCCDDSTNTFPYNCTIDSQTGSFSVTSKNTIIECSNSNTIVCKVFVAKFNITSSNIYVTVQRFGYKCDGIAHTILPYPLQEYCLPVCLPYSMPQNCWQRSAIPGYWCDNGFRRLIKSFPNGYCNRHFNLGLIYATHATFPDCNLQCNGNSVGRFGI